jgi:hypothetical protein
MSQAVLDVVMPPGDGASLCKQTTESMPGIETELAIRVVAVAV